MASRRDDRQDAGAPPQTPSEEQSEIAQREAWRMSGPKPGTVTVACKIPNGLILQNTVFESQNEPVMGGGHRDVKIGRKMGPRHVLKGPALAVGVVQTAAMGAGGFVLNFGVPKDLWDEWVRQNHDNDALNAGLIYGHESIDHVTAHCREHEHVMSGLEPLNPAKLPREVARSSANLTGIQTAER